LREAGIVDGISKFQRKWLESERKKPTKRSKRLIENTNEI
jgi:hypothetical protein